MSSELRILRADLDLPEHQEAIVTLIDAYARDPMGAGKALREEVKARLIPGLRAHPTTLVFLAYRGAQAIGIALCFRTFSSFRAQPMINVHDLAVLPEARGRGVGRRLLEAVIAEAESSSCCKVTLETQERNYVAQELYRSLGFAQNVHLEEAGGSIFMTRSVG